MKYIFNQAARNEIWDKLCALISSFDATMLQFFVDFFSLFFSFTLSGPSVDYKLFGLLLKMASVRWSVRYYWKCRKWKRPNDWNWTENAIVKSNASDLEWMLLKVFACKHELTIDSGENRASHSTLSIKKKQQQQRKNIKPHSSYAERRTFLCYRSTEHKN